MSSDAAVMSGHHKLVTKHAHVIQIWDLWLLMVNSLRPRQHGHHFPDDIFRCIFLNENIWIAINISLGFVPKGPIGSDNGLAPVRRQAIIWTIDGIGIDHDTVCAGVVGTAAAPAGTTSAVPDCSTNPDSADRISGQFLFYHDHN